MTISNCYNTGSVSASSSNYNAYAGGIVGYAYAYAYSSSLTITIANCYNTGEVTASSSNYNAYAGGIVGYAYAYSAALSSTMTITNCYNTGSVTASSNGNAFAGGIVGYASIYGFSSTVSVVNCYFLESKVLVNGAPNDNIIGGAEGDGTIIIDDNEGTTDNLPLPRGGEQSSGAKTEEKMTPALAEAKSGDSIYYIKDTSAGTDTVQGWDFDDIWTIISGVNDDYPILLSLVVDVTEVALDRSTIDIIVGDTTELTATVFPSDATDQRVTWSSSDTSVATVANGAVTAVNVGTAIITVTTVDGGHTATCEVTVLPVAVTGVTLDRTSVSLTAGNTTGLTATVFPSDATDKEVTWSSSDTSVATVANGVVTAVKVGTATITVTTNDGGFTATCAVTVKSEPSTVHVYGVSLNHSTLTLTVGGSAALTAVISPPNATDKGVTWYSSDTSVATVIDGKVTAHKMGTTVITVKTNDRGLTAACTVTVTAASGSFNVNLPTGEGYTATPAEGSSSPVAPGSSFSFVVVVDGGGTAAVKVNGSMLYPDDDGIYTIYDIREDKNITVEVNGKTPERDEGNGQLLIIAALVVLAIAAIAAIGYFFAVNKKKQ
jgi:uncharacterized protein YjdB